MIKTYKNAEIGESCKVYTHKSGLKVYVLEKPEYSSAFAIFGTRYGSIDTNFRIKGEDEFSSVPEGIAHYLEHKLFESEDGDAFVRYSKTGASANAFTSFDRTCYLFSCSSNFEQNYEILLDFVQHPYFTEQTVQKEQGIIGQEISMYDDSAPWRVLFNLLCALYKNHPVRIDIAGTKESIAQINADLLYKCYNTFYNLNNMFIVVSGNVDATSVFEQTDKLLKNSAPIEIERADADEPYEICKKRVEMCLPVSMPLFAIGYKERCETPQKEPCEQLAIEIILDILLGADSELYKDLLDSELINDSFGWEYFSGNGYASVIVEGESKNPDEVLGKINTAIEAIKKSGISEQDFIRTKKEMYGRSMSALNSVEACAMSLTETAFHNRAPFAGIDLIKDITLEYVDSVLRCSLNTENCAISVINSK